MRLLILMLLVASALNVFGETKVYLNEKNTVTFRGVVDPNSVAKAQTQLAEMVLARGKAKTKIYLVLDTPGGSIDAGMVFIEYAKSIPNLETVTIFAASMGSYFVQALPGKRNIISSGTLMFHRAYAGAEGYLEDGELEARVAYIKSIAQLLEAVNYNRIGLTKADYKQKVVTEWWMLGEMAVSAKTADEVVTIICSQGLIESKQTAIMQNMFFQAEVEYSGCPLFRAGKMVKPKTEEGLN